MTETNEEILKGFIEIYGINCRWESVGSGQTMCTVGVDCPGGVTTPLRQIKGVGISR